MSGAVSGARATGRPGHGAAAGPADDGDPLLARMRDAARAGGGKRSKLSVWMAEREAEIDAMIATYGADWEAWAALYVGHGLLAAPKGWGAAGAAGAAARRRAAETARQTFLRVRRRKRPGKGAAGPKAAPPPASARAPGEPADGGGMRRLVARDADAAERRLENLDREMRERSR